MKGDATKKPLHVEMFGEGTHHVVGLHGWNGSAESFSPLVEHLPRDVRFVAVDLPGYGRSRELEASSLEQVAREVLHTLDAHDIDDFSVLASCSGAFVGLFLGRMAGPRISRFVWLEPFAWVPWYLRLFLVPGVGRLCYHTSFGTALGRRITNGALAGRRTTETDMMASFARAGLEAPYRYLAMFDALERAEDFADVPGHKVLVCAERTFGAVRCAIDVWSEVWPEAEIRRIEGAGHLLLEEAPHRVARLLIA